MTSELAFREPPKTAARRIGVRSKNGTYSFECEIGERILYAGLRSGLPLPYECASGTCGTCKARTELGQIEELWTAAPGRSYLKPERGEFLMCQAVAHADCDIVVPGKLPARQEDTVNPSFNRGTIVATSRLTDDVIFLELNLQRPCAFQAGQFVVVKVPQIDGFRAYSMVNYDDAARRLQFVVKRKPGGAFSGRLFDTDVVGVEVELFGPLGKAVFRLEEDKDLLCIAGGSGIAGMMSILSRATREGYFDRHKGYVFFGIRAMKDRFFLEELSRFASLSSGNLEVTVALSEDRGPEGGSQHYPALRFASGLVHAVAAEAMAGKYGNIIAFTAGPPPMVDSALRMLILEARIPANDIRYDKFS